MRKKISAITLGCSKNEVDTELLLGSLDLNKYEIAEWNLWVNPHLGLYYRSIMQ